MSGVDYRCPAGALCQRIELQYPVETRDSMGGIVRTWTTSATVWAQVSPMTSREVVASGQVEGRTSHFIKIRHYSALRQSWRVKYGSRIFNIAGVRNVDERGKVMILDAIEET
jgi:SPP1 family predicted phage head-tail adaptor